MDRLSFAGTMPAPNVVPQRPAGYARALQDRAGLLVGATLAGAAVAGLAALTVPPRYEAAALIRSRGPTLPPAARRARPRRRPPASTPAS
ncbi:hypothetical protein [Cupriavidus gilardii]|uniref:hypothetical protein n=1 Tax=Cupriavidus gilardii TaxID=82541 RepID=UPI0021B4D17A|nr:hypothetical protein [Cupriavidus gilardii]UXC37964.1 hypothetical protein N4G38_22990 [Cupriavidus gilardii]